MDQHLQRAGVMERPEWTRSLHMCCTNGCTQLVIEHLGRGGHPDDADRHGRTALMLACMRLSLRNGESPKLVTLLLEAGGNVNVIDYHGRTPLILAAECWMFNGAVTAELLLNAGADVNVVSRGGNTALRWTQPDQICHTYELTKRAKMVDLLTTEVVPVAVPVAEAAEAAEAAGAAGDAARATRAAGDAARATGAAGDAARATGAAVSVACVPTTSSTTVSNGDGSSSSDDE